MWLEAKCSYLINKQYCVSCRETCKTVVVSNTRHCLWLFLEATLSWDQLQGLPLPLSRNCHFPCTVTVYMESWSLTWALMWLLHICSFTTDVMHMTDGSLPELGLMLHVPNSSTSDDLVRCSRVAHSSSRHSQITGSHRREILKAKRKNNCLLE